MGDMGKVPYSVSKSKRVEFVDTERSFVALDQDLPIATRCTMATTGVVCGAIETEAQLLQGAKPQINTCRPASMDIYIRPFRYMDVSILSHFEDMYQTVASRDQASQADVFVCGVDNGAGSSLIHLKPK